MAIAFVAIGDEVLRGETREANGHALAEVLAGRGVPLCEMRVIADDHDTVMATMSDLASRVALVITSGGLGPTDDDGTRKAMADVAGTELQIDDALENGIRARYERLGRRFVEINLRQAEIPAGSVALANRYGTAPGFAIQAGASHVAAFPGPPREFAGMLADHLDTLLDLAGIVAAPVDERCVRVFGITESALQTRMRELPGYDAVAVRSLPSFPEIRLEVRPLRADRADRADLFVQHLVEALSWRIFAADKRTTYAQALVALLQDRDATLAIAESCTGGLLGHLLTDVPGVSATLLGDFVTYANSAKQGVLGVDETTLIEHGAVSEQTAREMAEGARRVTGADYAVATTGIAGPSGGSDDKPVGTVCFAVSGPGGTTAHTRLFPGLDRSRFKRLAAWSAMALLRRRLAD